MFKFTSGKRKTKPRRYAVFFFTYILEDINHFGGGTGNSRDACL